MTISLRNKAARALVAALLAGQLSAQPATAAALPRWAAAVARLRSGQGRPKVVVIGDSTSMGMGAGTGPGRTDGARALGPSIGVARVLALAGLPATTTNAFGSHGVSADLATVSAYDPRLAGGAGWSHMGEAGSAAETFANYIDVTPLSFTPEAAVDSVDIYFVQRQGGGRFTVDVDGSPPLGTTATAGRTAPAIGRVGYRFARGRHRIEVRRDSRGGGVEIVGFDAFDTTKPAVSVIDMGWAGSTVAQHAGFLGQGFYAALKPDLVVIDLGINDARHDVVPRSYGAGLRQIVDVARPGGDVLLATPILSVPTTAHAELYSAYAAQLATLAATGAAGIYDQNALFGLAAGTATLPARAAVGFFGPDGIHLTAEGYRQKGTALGQAILKAAALPSGGPRVLAVP